MLDGNRSAASPEGGGQRAWSWLLRHLLLPAGDALFGQRMIQRLRMLEEAQWWDPERIADARAASLRSLVRVSYDQVPFYRDLMDRAGVRPGDVRAPSDLQRLPVVTKEMLRAAYPARTVRSTGYRTTEARTSGSTGTNFSVLTDSETSGWHRASFMLALHWAGWEIGTPHAQSGMTVRRGLEKRLKDGLLRCRYFAASDLRDEALDATLDHLERNRVRHLWGYPGCLFHLAARAAQRGWNQPLDSVVTWGDNLLPAYRRAIEQTFGVRVTDTYGCGEGMQIAAQCGVGTGYHLHDLDVVAEFLDADGAPVAEGTPGEVVVTRLHPGPMPLVRYSVGDRAVGGPSEPCACGRGFGRMASVQGRNAEVVTTPDGNRLIVHFFTGVLEHFEEIGSFQVVQSHPDSITVRVVPLGGFSEAVAAEVRSRLAERGAAALRIEVEPVAEIPLTAGGKRRFIINDSRPAAALGQEAAAP